VAPLRCRRRLDAGSPTGRISDREGLWLVLASTIVDRYRVKVADDRSVVEAVAALSPTITTSADQPLRPRKLVGPDRGEGRLECCRPLRRPAALPDGGEEEPATGARIIAPDADPARVRICRPEYVPNGFEVSTIDE
jgi:hypothetical protein